MRTSVLIIPFWILFCKRKLLGNKPACAGGTSTKVRKIQLISRPKRIFSETNRHAPEAHRPRYGKAESISRTKLGFSATNRHAPVAHRPRDGKVQLVPRSRLDFSATKSRPIKGGGLSINPVGGVGGSQPSDCQSDLSDMCGEVGSLAQQGFLAGFHGRTKGVVKTCFVGKDRQSRAFSTR